MSDITDEVDVQITAASAKISQVGFGLPLLLSFTAAWAERVREYNKLADVAADFAATTPEYLWASALFSQTPRPPKLLIGRCALPPTQKFEITPVVHDNYTYKFTINEQVVSYLSDGSATAAEITAGLKTALDLLGLAVTSSQQTGNTVLRIVANVAGAHFRFKTTDRANMPVVQNHADPGVATDLAAIALERNDWYALGSSHNSMALVQGVAAYATANQKLYVAQTIDTVVPGTAASGTDDIAEYLKNAGNDYTALIYSDGVADFADAGWFGRCLPISPGIETWKFKALSGVPAGAYSPTERSHMRAKNCNFYEPTAGVNMTEEGYLTSGRYIDFRRYLDYLCSNIAVRVYGDMVRMDRIPYDDNGIGIVENEVRGQLSADEKREVLDPAFTSVTVPKAAEVPINDRETRVLNGVDFSARYVGAIHKANITGRVTV